MGNYEELRHELLLTIRLKKTEIRNPFTDNMSSDKKISKALLTKTIQSHIFLGNITGKLDISKFIDV